MRFRVYLIQGQRSVKPILPVLQLGKIVTSTNPIPHIVRTQFVKPMRTTMRKHSNRVIDFTKHRRALRYFSVIQNTTSSDVTHFMTQRNNVHVFSSVKHILLGIVEDIAIIRRSCFKLQLLRKIAHVTFDDVVHVLSTSSRFNKKIERYSSRSLVYALVLTSFQIQRNIASGALCHDVDVVRFFGCQNGLDHLKLHNAAALLAEHFLCEMFLSFLIFHVIILLRILIDATKIVAYAKKNKGGLINDSALDPLSAHPFYLYNWVDFFSGSLLCHQITSMTLLVKSIEVGWRRRTALAVEPVTPKNLSLIIANSSRSNEIRSAKQLRGLLYQIGHYENRVFFRLREVHRLTENAAIKGIPLDLANDFG